MNPPQNAPAASALFGITPLLAGQRGGRAGTAQRAARRDVRAAGAGRSRRWREVGAPAGTLNVFCARPGPILSDWLDSPLTSTTSSTPATCERGLEAGAGVRRAGQEADPRAGRQRLRGGLGGRRPRRGRRGAHRVLLRFRPDLHGAQPGRRAPGHRRRAAGAARRRRPRRSGPATPTTRRCCSRRCCAASGSSRYVRDALDHGRHARARRARGWRSTATVSDTGPFLEPTVLRVDGLAARSGDRRGAARRRSSRCCR